MSKPMSNVSASSSPRFRSGLALCLSGGGYRAAIFHLGALRRLHELSVLEQVDTVSSVSGGSILSGFLAQRIAELQCNGLSFRDWEAEIARPFRRFVSRDLRTIPFLAHVPWNWLVPSFRVRHLMRRLERRLTSLRLADLPERPVFVFCATDMEFGTNFQFRRDEIGDYQAGYAETPRGMPLAYAVAASACFPPVFGPVRLGLPAAAFRRGKYRGDDRAELTARLHATDGGVYDNLGLEPVWKSHKTVLVSDGGLPITFRCQSTPLQRNLRYVSLLMNQVGVLRRRWLMEMIDDRYETFRIDSSQPGRSACPADDSPECRLRDRREVDRLRGTYWAVSSDAESYRREENGQPFTPPGYSNSFVKDSIRTVRTDLDKFVLAEVAALENHGYLIADAAIRKHLPDLIRACPPLAVPHCEHMDEALSRAEFRRAHSASVRWFWKRWFLRSFADL